MNIMEELNNLSKYQKDIDTLISRGDCLMLGLLNELQDQLGDSYKKLPQKEKERISQYSFNDKYNEWYNESLTIIKQLIPARLDDFIEYYKSSKRKGLLTYETYTISDYLINLCRKPTFSDLGVSKTSVLTKFEQQLNIVKSFKERFKSSLYDLKQLLQADIFDSELASAAELCKKGFYRAAGAVCGVVIEKHLHHVAISHNLTISKKNATINVYNDLLKNNGVIDTTTFRRIQLMGDIRNNCDHNNTKEPSKEDIEDLIDLTNKLIKNVY
jgi:uncharacterized protein (UPF0332 family)